jgi:hypothetical protein
LRLGSRLRWAWGAHDATQDKDSLSMCRRRPCSLVPPQSPDPTTTVHSAPRSQIVNCGCTWKEPGTRPPQISEARSTPGWPLHVVMHGALERHPAWMQSFQSCYIMVIYYNVYVRFAAPVKRNVYQHNNCTWRLMNCALSNVMKYTIKIINYSHASCMMSLTQLFATFIGVVKWI